MLLNKDGSFTRDIDIEELSVCFGGHYGKSITLFKDKITYRNTVHPTIACMDFPKGYFDIRSIPLSREAFIKLSDDIHNAGLLSILSPNENMELLDGAVYETMHCVFDDGSQYHYSDFKSRTSDIFKNICKILSAYCKFDSSTNEPVTIAMPKNKLVSTCDDVEREKGEFIELLRDINELNCRIKDRLSFLEIYGETSKTTVNVLREALLQTTKIEEHLNSRIQVYDTIKDSYITPNKE